MVPFVVVIVLLVIAALAYFLLRPDIKIVPEEERLVIYRLGRFDRVAGPGPILLSRDIDEIKRHFSIRNEPQNVAVDGLMMYGIPVGLTVNLWCRYDPVRAAGGDRERLRELVQFSESERHEHLAVQLRDALVHYMSALEQRAPLPPTATIVDMIVPILPGVPTCVEILQNVQRELAHTLPALGLYSDASHPLVITHLRLPEDMTKGFSRGRAASLLRMQLPDLPDSMMVHMLESIEGLAPLRIHEIRQVGNGANSGLEARWTDEDMLFREPLNAGTPPPHDKAASPAEAPADQPAPEPSHLSHGDLALLKRVPREPAGKRRVA